MNQHQQDVIHYLTEENRVLREQFGNRRMRFSDDRRRQLAGRAKAIGRKLLPEIDSAILDHHEERNHQSLGNPLIIPKSTINMEGRIEREQDWAGC